MASVIDGKFRNAGGFALAAFAMSLVGIIHSASLQMPTFSGVSMGYLIAAVFLFVYPAFHKEDELVNENLPVDEPQATAGE